MGLFSSKLESFLDVNSDSKSPMNSKDLVKLPADPRSPSDEIRRTPILVQTSSRPSDVFSSSPVSHYTRPALSTITNKYSYPKVPSLKQKIFAKLQVDETCSQVNLLKDSNIQELAVDAASEKSFNENVET